MYRNSAQFKCIPNSNALPSPDHTGDSDSEILDALGQKRRELDEEVAGFKAAKEREFREFERELRIKKKRSRTGSADTTPTKASSSMPSSSGALNLLASTQNGSAQGWPGYRSRKAGDASPGDKILKPAPLSKPTLSLEKLNINGETTPPLFSMGTTPPTPSFFPRSLPRSPAFAPGPVTPPRPQSEKAAPPTPSSTTDHCDPFAGVFTPAYLPLLESSDRDRRQPPLVRSPQPMNAEEEEKKRLQLDVDSKIEANKQLTKQLESSQSLPPQPVSPTILSTKRAKSTPLLPSTSLPSALRSSSGGGRKNKHVTFQLADLKVVDPSSSYEETEKVPEIRVKEEVFGEDEEEKTQSLEPDSMAGANGTAKGGESPRMLGEKEKRRGKGGSRLFSPIPSPQPSPAPSPVINGGSPSLLVSPAESGFTGGLIGAEDGGSGVGFFELDEELASPALRDGKVPTFEFHEYADRKDQAEDDVDKIDDNTVPDIEEEEEEEEEDEEDDEEVDETLREKISFVSAGTRSTISSSMDINVPSVTVGSVPIDIVRPTGSWVGSFGH